MCSGSKWRLDDHSIPKKIDCSQYREIYDSVIGLQDLELAFDPRIFFLAVFITILANVIFGLLPAFLGSRVEPAATLKEQSFHGRSAGPRWRRILIVAQVVLSFVLLVGAGLSIRFILRFESTDPGFDLNVLVVNPGAPTYDRRENKGYRARVSELINALPGVHSSGWAASSPPETASGFGQYIRPEGTNSGEDNYLWIDCILRQPFDAATHLLKSPPPFPDTGHRAGSMK